MKRLLYGHDEQIAQWTFDTFKLIGPANYDMAVGIVDDDKLVGSIIWSGYRGTDVEISYFGHDTMTRGIAKEWAVLALDYFKVSRVTARTARSNKTVTRGVKKLGFEYEGICHHGYGDEDAVMYGLYGRNLYRLAGRTLQ